MGRLGMLDILVDGNVVYSYQQTRRMPSDAEVLQLLSAK
jgi:hypothetical protein